MITTLTIICLDQGRLWREAPAGSDRAALWQPPVAEVAESAWRRWLRARPAPAPAEPAEG